MNLKEYLSITPEISAAIRDGKPVVALESTILSHGMPYPDNLAFAAEVERIVRAEGAVPATMAIIDGVLKVGLTQDELELMCKGEGVAKVSRRDLPIMVAEKRTGATTVASTMILASLAGIRVFATGGIGGVHRGEDDPGYRPDTGVSGDHGRSRAGPAHRRLSRVLLPQKRLRRRLQRQRRG